MPSKFPCLGQKKLKYNATSPCSNGFLQSFIKLRSHSKVGKNGILGRMAPPWLFRRSWRHREEEIDVVGAFTSIGILSR